jgi:hypothetical protein
MKWLPIGEILISSGASYTLRQLTHPFFGQPIHGADFWLGIGDFHSRHRDLAVEKTVATSTT